ncbi:alpha/beta hydrolase [Leifsonia sp. EB34]|uniref:alpha/beta hydrolase n=1 Tax=Leifsonia sp. EB34 TaxID=3156303 RepID=UPI00351404B6
MDTLAAELRRTAEWLWLRSNVLESVHATIAAPYWSGVAAEVFAERLRGVVDGARASSARHGEGSDAARRWSTSMAEAQSAADRALRDAEIAQADLVLAEASLGLLTGVGFAGTGSRDPAAETELLHARFRLEDAQQRLDDARRKALIAKDDYDTAEEQFVRQLDATLHGALPHASLPELGNFITLFGTITGVESASVRGSGLLDLLTALTPEQAGRLLAEDPRLAQRFWDDPPPPERVASWWKGLSAEVREAWCQSAPTIIGNLPGLDAETRIHANSIQLRRDLYDPDIDPDSPQGIVLRDILKALRVDGISGPWLDYEKLAKRLHPPRGLLSYNLRHRPPLAAVALGEPSAEKSGKVTWAVPGMNSGLGVPDRLAGWTGAALNVYKAQDKLEPGVPHMVVAWIGYDSPADLTVLEGDRARAGGSRLSHELDGQWAADTILGGNRAPHTAVVGHSYGTTVVANAVSGLNHNVQSVVLLASAGVEQNIGTVDRLHVDGGGQHVYASQSSDDTVADKGRWASGRKDPRDDGFGARTYSSEGDLAHNLEPTDGHDPIGYGTENGPWFNPHATRGHGYLDMNTEALHNTAAASVGLDGEINGGATSPGTGKKK